MNAVDYIRTGNQCVSVTLTELLTLCRRAKELSLSTLRPRSTLSGQRPSRLFARGMEFAESRRYQPGDDIRHMDWRVTARTGKAHTKLFTVEKERQVLLAVDMRASMFFATQGVFKSVQAALMAGNLAWNVSQNGDRLGGMIFDDKQLFEYRPALRKKGLLPLLHGLAECADFSAKKNNSDGLVDRDCVLDNAIASIHQIATPGSLIFMVSDFRHFSDYARDLLIQVSRHCELCLCFVYDPLEADLPKNGSYAVTNGGSEVHLNTYDKNSLDRYQRQFVARRAKVASMCAQSHIHFIECSTRDDCFEVLRKHFKK